ncbi:MAG: hypothetical protein K2X77_31515 [Candidatus Obscuribacterales bacterium]|nr:hypothetical protein [Candidatus Obscuribacterales bacterium]
MIKPATCLVICALLFLQNTNTALAQANGQSRLIERRLTEADSFFQQNDFEMGANRVVEACSMLRSSPQSMPGNNYVQIASSKAAFIDGKLNASLQNRDFETAKKLVTAEQNLLTSLSNWQPQNAGWHYQKAKLYHIESGLPMTGVGAAMAKRLGVPNNLHNQVNMQPLQYSIQECEQALNSPDQSFRNAANKLKSTCESEIQRRTGNLQRFSADYNRRLPKGQAQPTVYDPNSQQTEHYCSKCGGGHSSWICPNTHGG